MGLVIEDLQILDIKQLILSAKGAGKKESRNELQKLKLQHEAQKSGVPHGNDTDISEQPKLELKKLIPRFNLKEDDMAIFLKLFERQLIFLKIPESQWVAYLIEALLSDIATLITWELDDEAYDYMHVKEMLLRRFKLSV
ncbi:uncharacterized protein TNCV_4535221 [Trichonephila clavipes]|nr:uncharacterized protein TNCV_4535221 [Trichonephila clavipes]